MTLSRIVLLLACAAALLFGASAAVAQAPPGSGKFWVFIGTYTGGPSKGIYRFTLDTKTGATTEPELAAELTSPSFLAIHPSHRYLYAVNEVNTIDGKKAGAVSAFALDVKTGRLTPLNRQSSGGAGPCHVSVDREGKTVLVANYGGGSVSSIPIKSDGSLAEPATFIQHKGKGTDPRRQEGPHAHSINVDAGNRFAVAADLGLDKLLVYRLDPDKGTLTPNDPPSTSLAPGAGPRHFAFHPSGKFAYVINEMNSTVTALDYDASKGTLTPKQSLSTLPEGKFPGNSTAEVQVHPSGKFVYGSNRGHNSIAIFRVDEATGKLTPAGHQGKGIKTPRNFGIDPTGKYLLVGSQAGDEVLVFRVNEETGALEPTGDPVKVPKPVCVKFVPVAE